VLFTVTTTHEPATDLGYLLHKHPDRVQQVALAYGAATVFFPVAEPTRCTAALLLDVDPIGLARARGNRAAEAFSLGQYVNDRPYAASSLLAVALGRAFRTAMQGRCDARPELAATAIPLELALPAVPSRGGADLAGRLFGPLGWQVEAEPVPLDERFPDWGDSRYVRLRLTGVARLADALTHLYVLLPVLDDAKHYWVAPDEVEKLLTAGGEWLGRHPERALIVRRYLRRGGALTRETLARLAETDDTAPERLDDAVPVTEAEGGEPAEEAADRRAPLRVIRRRAVLAALREAGAARVLDLGCGDGVLLADLLAEASITRVVGVDVSCRALAHAERRLNLERMPDRARERVTLLQGALTYTDERLVGYDAAVLMEVIEHVDPPRLPALERAVFGVARPATVVVTTPNVEYNVRYEWLPPGQARHPDHRFEWTRAEFADWARRVADAHGYQVRHEPVGPADPDLGPATQLAVFTR
jgi:3' terminal RNA ribose 2'-O-methyltransferase Hen1